MEKKILLNKINHNKKRYYEIDFVRVCSAIGIIIYHFFVNSKDVVLIIFYKHANGDWGFSFVTIFICISGMVLHFNYPKIISYKIFYYKRWKSIFPQYYLCFIYFYSLNVINKRKVFYKGNGFKLLFTLFGMDGYLFYKYSTYYIIGEWFIGAILILYLEYPLLILINNKLHIFIIPLILFLLYPLILFTNIFGIIVERNMITCTGSFFVGIIISKFYDFFQQKYILLISVIINIILTYVTIPYLIIIVRQIHGFSLLIFLLFIGKYIMNTRLKTLFIELSKISYGIFLFQNQNIANIKKVFPCDNWYYIIIILLLTILLTIICAKILSIVVDSIFQSKLFRLFELKILTNKKEFTLNREGIDFKNNQSINNKKVIIYH